MDLHKLQDLTEEFLRFFAEQRQINLDDMPQVNFVMDEKFANDPFGMTGYYNPENSEIYAFVPGRHYKDIMRTVAHECIHHVQNLRGDLSEMGDMGEGYAQNNEKMREMEKEAYLEGNMLFRDWTDTRKEGYKKKKLMKESCDLQPTSKSEVLYKRLLKKWTRHDR